MAEKIWMAEEGIVKCARKKSGWWILVRVLMWGCLGLVVHH